MKWILLMIAFLSHTIFADQIIWHTDYKNALEMAKKENKPLLLYFTGSDWCGWSMKLKKEILDSDPFISEVKDQFVFMQIDFPIYKNLPPNEIEQNRLLKEKNDIQNFPVLVLMDNKERIISKLSYISEGAKSYADYLIKLVKQDQELTMLMSNFQPENLTSLQIENYYRNAMLFKRNNEAMRLLEAGIHSDNSLYFLTEKYRMLVENGKAKSDEARELRNQLLSLDPSNQKKMQFFIALTDFQILSSQMAPGKDAKKVTEPLIEYLNRFGDQDVENAWRVQMMLAQFYYDYAESAAALEHAQIAYEHAPKDIKPEIQKSMEYIRTHPAS